MVVFVIMLIISLLLLIKPSVPSKRHHVKVTISLNTLILIAEFGRQ